MMERECFHIFIVCLMLAWCTIGIYLFSYFEADYNVESHRIQLLLYVARIFPLFALFPVVISNFLGLVLYETKGKAPKMKTSLLFSKFICFRVYVGRLNCNEDVVSRTEQNVKTCLDVGLRNFIFEIVSERSLGFSSYHIREIVVPSKYQTPQNSHHKSRALQYCLENGVNILSFDDWIVHLSAGSEITRESVIDIVNFIYDNRYSIGQGLVTCKNRSVNVISIMADSLKVAMDYGLSRFTFGILHIPLFGVKSTFLVCSAAVEMKIGLDFASEPDQTVENLMVLKAWQYGFKIGLLNSEMYENSTTTFFQYLSQKRWLMNEIFQTISSPFIRFRNKIGICILIINTMLMHFAVSYFVLHWLFPLPGMHVFTLSYGFIFGLTYFMNLFGTYKTHSHIPNLNFKQYFELFFISVSVIPISLIIESSALHLSLFSRRKMSLEERTQRSELNNIFV